MAIIKCKMCGGDIELAADKTFGTCEFCGSTMTLPKVDDDQRAAAFNRGNHFRRIGEFDKALAVYERIVREDDTDAEAHWCCALCRFGIEYVEDPATYEYLPTCHRASFDSFLEDVDYLAAVEHSEGITKRQYQKDGAKIAEVQRGILATSQNEEPFDVFICYKESDENGERTRDSLMAQDVYYQLTDQGYRVFFARITLEDMAGKQYEPYIFAALNSAKVMIAIGTKPEYMNAVWVKNEWSRFLAMMKKDRHKLLLPCYRDMDPYDMPEQLSVLQSYDMSKIGFIQDLTRGIKKVLDAEKKPEQAKETVVVQKSNTGAAPLLKRGYISLEDSDWKKADQLFEEVLNLDPECTQAYVGKLLAAEKVSNLKALVQKHIEEKEEATVEVRFVEATGEDEEADTLESQRLEAEEEAVSKYTIPGYLTASTIQKLFEIKEFKYYSEIACREEQLADEKAYWDNNRELNRALKYADPQEKKQIEDARSLAISSAKERLQKALSDIEAYKSDIPNAYRIQIEEAKTAVEQAYDAAIKKQEADCCHQYEKACKMMRTAKTLDDFRQAKSAFTAIYTYRDSMEKAKECRAQEEKLTAVKKHRETLNQEIADLMTERMQLGFFAAKRKKEIDERIQEIHMELL